VHVGKYHYLDKRNSLLLKCILLTGLAGAGGSEMYAQVPAGIIGGTSNTSGQYAALISNDGLVSPISGLTGSSPILTVAMNQSGNSIIGGGGYAALVSPTGTLTPLSLSLSADGAIQGVSINQNSLSLIGGETSSMGLGVAAFIQPDGTIVPQGGLSLPNNPSSIITTAINCMNVGLIGGEGNNALYAAFVTTNGTVTPINVPNSLPNGSIISVAINSEGVGIVGGGLFVTYAAFVTPATAGAPLVLSPIPPTGIVNGVAINDAGMGLFGGQDGSFNAFAGYAAPTGVVTPISTPFSGLINSVALNSTGAGIIGGQNGANIYAALVEPNGSLTVAATGSTAGEIFGVAINEAGVGLIGGQTGSGAGYAALVAPNGAVTLLNPASGYLNATDVSDKAFGCLEVTPQTIGPYFSAAYAQFAASKALETFFVEDTNCPCTHIHCHEYNEKNCFDEIDHQQETAHLGWSDDELMVSIRDMRSTPTKKNNNKQKNAPAKPSYSKKNSIWMAPFGSYVHVKDHGKIPKYNNQIGGGLLAFDHKEGSYRAGAALGYAFNYIHYGKGLGHGKIQEELGCFYGAYLGEHININGALWGGGFQFSNRRHTLSSITSKGKTHGWLLAPQLEVASPWSIDQKGHYLIEPYVALDWFNGWQKHYTETGKSGLNLKVPHWHYSLLQSEVGIRFRERFVYSWGYMRLDETISYVNQAPFDFKKNLTTGFVGASSTFPVAVASDKIENLASLGLMCIFKPRNDAYPYGGFSLQAMANRTYQAYFATVYLGMDF